jgi:hypothetical protein
MDKKGLIIYGGLLMQFFIIKSVSLQFDPSNSFEDGFPLFTRCVLFSCLNALEDEG